MHKKHGLSKNKHPKLFIFVSIGTLFMILIGILSYRLWFNKIYYPEELQYTGFIEKIDNSQSQYRMKVGNYWIVTNTTEAKSQKLPKGKVIYPETLNYLVDVMSGGKVVGSKVEVYVSHVNYNIYTIYGDNKYFIKFVD
jgi:hypothetical protein